MLLFNGKMVLTFLLFKQIVNIEIHKLTAAHKGRQRPLSACVSVWTESHKVYKVWALINKVLTRCFHSYGIWLTSQIIKLVEISDSVDINQSIWMNQFYPIEDSDFIIIQSFQLTQEERVTGSKKHETCAVA